MSGDGGIRDGAPALLTAALSFTHIGRAFDAAAWASACPGSRSCGPTTAPLPVRRHGTDAGGGGVERVLISEIVVWDKGGEPLEQPRGNV